MAENSQSRSYPDLAPQHASQRDEKLLNWARETLAALLELEIMSNQELDDFLRSDRSDPKVQHDWKVCAERISENIEPMRLCKRLCDGIINQTERSEQSRLDLEAKMVAFERSGAFR
jgi:hypothetical protein